MAKPIIKEASINDSSIIIEMVCAMCDEISLNYKRECIENVVVKSLQLAPCFLLEKHGKICGMAGLTLYFNGFSDQATLTEYGFYIRPSHREYSAFSGLIDKCKEYAKKVNMPLKLNFQANASDEFKMKLFKRKGFAVSGISGEYNV